MVRKRQQMMAQTELEERLVDIRPAFVTHPQPAELMQPGDGALDHPAGRAQTAAVFRIASRDMRADATDSERPPVGLRVIASVCLNQRGFASRPAPLSCNRRDALDQGQQLGHVMPVGFGEDHGQRNALGIGEEVVFRARLTAIGWVQSSFFPRARHV